MENKNRFLIDTGAEVTLIKITSLEGETLIYEDKRIKLKGIDKDASPTETIGCTYLTFNIGDKRVYQTLHVVPDNFPIKCNGVIGSDFLSKTDSIISYKENKIRICGTEFKIEHDEIKIASENLRENMNESTLRENMCDENNESDMCYDDLESNMFESDCEIYPQNMLKKEMSNENNMNERSCEVHPQELKIKKNYKNDGSQKSCETNPQKLNESANIEREVFVIEPRCEKVISICIENPNLTEGIIPEPIKLQDGVYLCPSIVKVHNNKALTVCLNTTDKEVEINKLFVKLEPLANELREMNEIINVNKINNDMERNRLSKLEQTLRTDHLNKEEKQSLVDLCKQYNHVFHLEGDKLSCTNTVMHEIPTNNNNPINTKSYRYPEALKEEVNEQIGKLLKDGIIQPSNSPWNSPVWVVPKKMDASGKKKWRLVIDYRKLNEITIGDVYPLPQINDILDQLGHSKYFTTLDLASGFHQIKMSPKDQAKTAFSVPLGHYEYTRMPFGLKNAPATFQRLMNNVLVGLQGLKCFVYLDDIVVYGSSLQDHNMKLKEVFDRLSQHNLKLQPDKCEFLKKEVMYLGHLITQNGVKPDPKKIEAIQNYPIPKTPKDIKAFLGLAGYYRRFIENFSKLSQPLTKLLKKDEPFIWTSLQQDSFETLKTKLCEEPILQYPNYSEIFNLTTDASNYAIGSVLSQGSGSNDLPIAYASRILNKSEINYSTTEKELLAIVWSVKHFRPYLYGRKFRIITDHKPLTWLMNVKDPGSRLVRWRLLLEEYDYEIVYKQGKLNQNADALSRIKPENTETSEVIKIHNMTKNGESYSSFLKEMERKPILYNKLEEYNDKLPNNKNRVVFTSSDLDIENDKNLVEYESYIKELKSKKPGQYEVLSVQDNSSKIYFIFPKLNYWDNVTYEDIFECFKNLKHALIQENIKEINLTSFCNFHLKWHKIRTIIRYIFKDTEISINIFHGRIQTPKKEDIPSILEENHSNVMSGHTGFHKTYKKIKANYQWDTMKKDIKEFIKKCESCQKNKINRKKNIKPMEITSTSTKAFQKIALDIVGPLPLSENGNKYILTLQDDLTKFSQAYPLPKHDAETIADCFVRNFICKFGIPEILLTDQGADFTSNLIKEISKLFKIKKINTSAYHPQSNGALERSHSTLADYLKHYVNEDQTNWDKWIDFAMFSYNTSVHTSTQFTPFELIFGFKANLPSSIVKEPEFKYYYDNYLDELILKLQKSREIARNKLINSKEYNKQIYDKKCKNIQFKVGDSVYLSNEAIKPGKSRKLSPYWLGPYKIIEVNSSTNVTIKIKNKKLKVHTNRLKHAFVSE